MSNQLDQMYNKWHAWIGILDKEVRDLYTQRHVFQSVQEIVRDNSQIQSPGDFNYWLTAWYASSMSVAVRRQTDANKDSISYRRLLEEMKNNPTVLSRSRYKAAYVDDDYTESDADEGFDQLVGRGRAHIDSADVAKEIQDLEVNCRSRDLI